MEYKKNGELSEVFYYQRLKLNEEQQTGKEVEQPGTQQEICLPSFGLKKKPVKYRKPKRQPKASVYDVHGIQWHNKHMILSL